jgi:hypothetical protein
VPHQVPRPQLAPLVERQQQVRFQPQNAHRLGIERESEQSNKGTVGTDSNAGATV